MKTLEENKFDNDSIESDQISPDKENNNAGETPKKDKKENSESNSLFSFKKKLSPNKSSSNKNKSKIGKTKSFGARNVATPGAIKKAKPAIEKPDSNDESSSKQENKQDDDINVPKKGDKDAKLPNIFDVTKREHKMDWLLYKEQYASCEVESAPFEYKIYRNDPGIFSKLSRYIYQRHPKDQFLLHFH